MDELCQRPNFWFTCERFNAISHHLLALTKGSVWLKVGSVSDDIPTYPRPLREQCPC